MIVSLVFLFILAALLMIFSSARGAWQVSQVRMDVSFDARNAMELLSRELREGSSSFAGTFTFFDGASGSFEQGLWMASARGSPAVGGEDGSSNNNYMHVGVGNVLEWRSVIVFCSYSTTEGLRQLRRYVDYGPTTQHYAQADIFPLTFVSATATTLRFMCTNGVIIDINRAGGRVMANNLGSEDANANNLLDGNENDGSASLPMDNADGFLDLGFNAALHSGRVDVRLFLARNVLPWGQGGRVVCSSLRQSIAFRQP
ncbi:MAG: hypothetical protein NC924_05510 [Candidatus Omnitrophica bacterium]|nr:hypothetical protein [Candidatus Omnitrophota bacterium]